MLDGCRADALENATAPNIRMLAEGRWQPGYRAAWTRTACTILDGPTHSAPNHAAIATGVTAAKTNVRGIDELNEKLIKKQACKDFPPPWNSTKEWDKEWSNDRRWS